jgi:hypothetical protein
MSLTDKEINPYVDLHLANAGTRGEGESTIRWITRQLYIDIQCLAIAAGLQRKIDEAREEGRRDRRTEELLMSLLSTGTELEDRVQWLQNYKGRALLTCTMCLELDVEAVLEIKEGGERRRFCPKCYARLNLKSLYGNVPNSPDTLPIEVKSLPERGRYATDTGRVSSSHPNMSNGPSWAAICDCGATYNGGRHDHCPKCGKPV